MVSFFPAIDQGVTEAVSPGPPIEKSLTSYPESVDVITLQDLGFNRRPR